MIRIQLALIILLLTLCLLDRHSTNNNHSVRDSLPTSQQLKHYMDAAIDQHQIKQKANDLIYQWKFSHGKWSYAKTNNHHLWYTVDLSQLPKSNPQLYTNWLQWSKIHNVDQYGVSQTNKKFQSNSQNIQKLKSMVNQFIKLGNDNQSSSYFNLKQQDKPDVLKQQNVLIKQRSVSKKCQFDISNQLSQCIKEQSGNGEKRDNLQLESMRRLIGQETLVSAKQMFIDLGDHIIQVRCSHFKWNFINHEWYYMMNHKWFSWDIQKHDLLYSNWECWSEVNKIDRYGVFQGDSQNLGVDSILSSLFNFQTKGDKRVEHKSNTKGVEYLANQNSNTNP